MIQLDGYTKVILTAITVALWLIVLRPFLEPKPAIAQDSEYMISRIKSVVSSIKSVVDSIESEVSSIESEVSSIKSEVSSIKSDVDGIASGLCLNSKIC